MHMRYVGGQSRTGVRGNWEGWQRTTKARLDMRLDLSVPTMANEVKIHDRKLDRVG